LISLSKRLANLSGVCSIAWRLNSFLFSTFKRKKLFQQIQKKKKKAAEHACAKKTAFQILLYKINPPMGEKISPLNG